MSLGGHWRVIHGPLGGHWRVNGTHLGVIGGSLRGTAFAAQKFCAESRPRVEKWQQLIWRAQNARALSHERFSTDFGTAVARDGEVSARISQRIRTQHTLFDKVGTTDLPNSMTLYPEKKKKEDSSKS